MTKKQIIEKAKMEQKYDNYIYELEAKVKAERRKHPIRWMWYDLRNWYLIMIIRVKVFLRKLIWKN